MAKKTSNPTGPQSPRQSWGWALGILTSCGITLLGVLLNLEPETILLRALIGGGVVGLIVSLVASSLRLVTPQAEEE